jgi:hypothetical protein
MRTEMKKTLTAAIIAPLMTLAGCSSRPLMVTCQTEKQMPASSESTVTVVEKDKLPEGAVRIGSVKAEDNGGRTKPKDCTFDKVFEAVLIKAHEMGGNYVVLTKHTEPNKKKLEPCHALEAEVYILE